MINQRVAMMPDILDASISSTKAADKTATKLTLDDVAVDREVQCRPSIEKRIASDPCHRPFNRLR